MKRNLALLFALAIGLSTCGMAMLEPWIIAEVVDGTHTSSRHMFGYALMIATSQTSIAAAVQFARIRGWKFIGVTPWMKLSSTVAGLGVAMVVFMISYVVGSLVAQMVTQA